MSVYSKKHLLVGFFILYSFVLWIFPHTTHAAVTTRPGSMNGLVGYWSLNEGINTVTHDASGNGNTGTLSNGASWVLGKQGYGLSFNNNSSNEVQIADSASLRMTAGQKFSVAAWIKNLNLNGSFQEIFRKGSTADAWFLLINSTNQISLSTSGSSGEYNSGYAFPTDGKWHHVVGTFDGSTIRIYLDGVLVTSYAGASTSSNTDPAIIGNTTIGLQVFNGSIDEVRVYKRELSQADVTSLYRTSGLTYKIPSRNGSVAYWPFDDNSSTRVRDVSGLSNNGTAAGSSGGLPSWVAGKRARALHFDGIDDEVDVSQTSALNLSDNITISAWVKPDASLDGDIFQSGLGVGGAMTIWMAASQGNQIWFGRQQGDVPDWAVSTTQFVPGQWIHITGVLKNGVETIYINGLPEGSSGSNGTFTNGATYLIGKGDDGNFQGAIDDMRIYNRALSATEVLSNYRSGVVQINASQNIKLTNGLVGLWSFNGADVTSSTALDRSNSGNTLSYTSAPQPVLGKLGQAITFNGTNYASVSDNAALDPTAALSVSGWVKFNVVDGAYRTIVAKWDTGVHDQYVIQINADNHLGFWTGDGGSGASLLASTNTMSPNVWYHFVATISGTSKKLYINGSLDNSGTGATSLGSSVAPFSIGSKLNGGGTYFEFLNGSVDEVRIYNRALSADEARQLYLMGK